MPDMRVNSARSNIAAKVSSINQGSLRPNPIRAALRLCFLVAATGAICAPLPALADFTLPPACWEARQARAGGDESRKTVSTMQICEMLPMACGVKFFALEGSDKWGPAVDRCMADTIAGKHSRWSLPRR
jgi:hypothetical protein